MGSYSPEEYVAFVAQFDMDVISRLDPADFIDFGVMDSKKYATKLFRIMDDQRLSTEEKTMVIVLATAVKNKKRILNAMKKFQGKSWYNGVRNFYANNCVQYTNEEDDDTFSVVHVPSSVAWLTARIYLQMTSEPTVEEFLRNLWAAQLNLSPALMLKQREWEEDFWDNVVKKGGKNFEKNKFNKDYWETKAADKYLLLDANGSVWGTPDERSGKVAYTEERLKEWFKTKVDHREARRAQTRAAEEAAALLEAEARLANNQTFMDPNLFTESNTQDDDGGTDPDQNGGENNAEQDN